MRIFPDCRSIESEGFSTDRAVFVGCHAGQPFEHPAQVLRMLESELVGDLAHRLAGREQQLFHPIDQPILDVFRRGFAGQLPDQVAEIVGRQTNFVGKIPDRRESFVLRCIGVEVSVQQLFETGDYVVVHLAACRELAIVEAHAVVEQHADVGCDKPPAVLVERVVEFAVDFPHRVENRLSLLFREVQGFVGGVREEGVPLDLLSERGAANQVGVEKQAVSRGACSRYAGHFGYLSRREADDRAVLIIIGLSPVLDVSALHLFQEKGVDAVAESEGIGPLRGLREIDHRHQRMPCLQTETLVVGLYRVDFRRLFHGVPDGFPQN